MDRLSSSNLWLFQKSLLMIEDCFGRPHPCPRQESVLWSIHWEWRGQRELYPTCNSQPAFPVVNCAKSLWLPVPCQKPANKSLSRRRRRVFLELACGMKFKETVHIFVIYPLGVELTTLVDTLSSCEAANENAVENMKAENSQ